MAVRTTTTRFSSRFKDPDVVISVEFVLRPQQLHLIQHFPALRQHRLSLLLHLQLIPKQQHSVSANSAKAIALSPCGD